MAVCFDVPMCGFHPLGCHGHTVVAGVTLSAPLHLEEEEEKTNGKSSRQMTFPQSLSKALGLQLNGFF